MKDAKQVSLGIMSLPGDLALSFLPLLLWAILGPALGLLSVRDVPGRFVAGFSCGLAALVAAVLLRLGLEALFPPLIPHTWLLASITEETARYASIGLALSAGIALARPLSATSVSPRQRILWFGLFAGLSFAALENLWFAINAPAAIPLRLLLTVPVHGGAGLLIADCFVPGAKTRRGLVLAIAFHAAWDYFMAPSLAAIPVYRLFALFSLLGMLFASFLLWNIVPRDGD